MRGEYWLRLQQVHCLTSCGLWTLCIDKEDSYNIAYTQYEDFQIGDATSFYQLSIGAYSSTAEYDTLSYHNGQLFSTKDRDHDTCTHCQSFNDSCTLTDQGVWWYNGCFQANHGACRRMIVSRIYLSSTKLGLFARVTNVLVEERIRNVSTTGNYKVRNLFDWLIDLPCSLNHTATNYLKQQVDYYTWGYCLVF